MGIVSGVVVFVIIWWLVFFMVLPHGNAPPEVVEKGHMDGAPARPRLWRKVLITTAATIVLMIGYYFLAESGLISFRPPVE